MKFSLLGLALYAGALGAWVATAEALEKPNLIVNGSFEETNASLQGYPYFKEPATNTLYKSMNMIPAGNKGISGWTIDSGNVDWIGEWGTSDGQACIDLNGDRAGTISQTFQTVPGQLYVLNFDLSANPDLTNRVSSLRVSVGDKTKSYSVDRATFNKGKPISITNLACQTQTLKFRATGTQTKITFASLETTGTPFVGGYARSGYIYAKPIQNSKPVIGLLAGPVIDNVRITPALDNLQLNAKAVPVGDVSKIWFQESESAAKDILTEEPEN